MTETSPSSTRPSLDRDPESPRASARRHWPCNSIAAEPSSASSKPKGVIQRQGDDFALDQSRVAYLRYLRRERRQSLRGEADADHVKVKTELLQLRLMEKKGELVRRADVDALIDGIAGVTLTACRASLHAARRVAILRSGAA